MNTQEELIRRVHVSADISDYVYTYEINYTKYIQERNEGNNNYSNEKINELARNETPTPKNTKISHSAYDSTTGVAAIAVYDSVTGETYIAYAGTNMDADGSADVISDVNIGFNNSLALKKLEESATSFYREVQKSGANVTVTTGHSFGDFLSTRVAIVEQTPYKFGYQGAPQSVSVKTILEMNYESLLSSKVISKEELDKLIVR
ncbi:TPA: hypothetical protein ACT2IF_002336, partial [Streptococcus suis]